MMMADWSLSLSNEELSAHSHKIDGFISIRGTKDDKFDGSTNQIEKVQKFHEDYFHLLSHERIEKLGNLAIGHWFPDKDLVKLEKDQHKIWSTMGFMADDRKWLHPEEALYLMETNAIQVMYLGLPLSIQECYTYFFNASVSIDEYRVYSHLRRLDYIVRRHKQLPPCDLIYDLGDSSSFTFPETTPANEDRVSTPPMAESSNISNNLESPPAAHSWDFHDIAFPNTYGLNSLQLSAPEQHLLPQNVHLTSEIYEIDLNRVAADNRGKTRKLYKDQSDDLTYSHSRFNEDLKKSARNWPQYKRLLDSRMQEYRDNIREKSQENINSLSSINYAYNSRFKISFDVFRPNTHFKKKNPGRPHQYVCVTRLHEEPPSLWELMSLHQNGDVPLVWAILSDCGDISFVLLQPTDVRL